jgi:Cu/Ag efflux pump CusA
VGAIIRASSRFRLLVVAVAAGVLAVGSVTLRDAPVDVLPEFTPPYAEVQTEALGLSAAEVENLITVPLEADLLNGVEDVDVIRSESLPGLSSIVLVFKPGSDIYRARQLVQERLAHAHALPKVSKPPTLLQPLSTSSRVLMIGISSDRVSAIEQSVIARWTVRPRLMGVPGVANVAVWGMRDQQIQVQVDPERLRDRDVTLSQVVSTAGNAQIVSPLSFLEASTPGSGGFIETPQQRLQVRNVLERLADPAELGKVPVEGTSGRLRLRDVANVGIGHQPLIGDAVVGDGAGLLLVVEKFPGASTLEVTRGVESALEKLRPGLAGMRTDTSVFRPATFVEAAIDNLTLALAIGAGLLALGLVALLRRWRTVLIALVVIPLAFVTSALALDAFGESFNAISFAGLAAAVAVVVDDAVLGAGAIAARLRAGRDPGAAPVPEQVVDASRRLRGPLVYGTLIALLAVAPIAVMQSRPGAFFAPLALAYALAIAASTLVALTVTPALGALLHSRGRPARRTAQLPARLRRGYDAALGYCMRRQRIPLVAAGAGLAGAVVILALVGTSVIPSFRDRGVRVQLSATPGTSNPRMTEITTAVSRELRSLPGVENVGAHVGRAVTGDQRVDVNSSELWVSLAPGADHDATVRRIEDVVRGAGVQSEVGTYTTQRIREVGALVGGDAPPAQGLAVLTGSAEPLVTRVYGQDLETLGRQADEVRRVMASVDGVVDPRVDSPAAQPNLVIEVDLDRARRLAIKPGDVRRAEATLLQGIQVGSVFDDQKVFDVIVQGVPATRRSAAAVRNLLIDRPGGGHVRLGQVADVRTEQTPVAIDREAVSRHLDVTAGVRGRGVDAVADDVRARLATVAFPLEYHAEVIAQTTGKAIGATTMLALALVAALAVLLLLQAAVGSWRLALAAFALLPVALAGGVFAGALDGALSLGSLVGFVALLGLAARTSVLSIRWLQNVHRGANGGFGSALVRRGAAERLAPILATAVALALLVLPLAALGSRPGLEVVHPFALVLLGGLATSTLVSLFVLPVAYLRLAAAPPPPAEWDRVHVTRWTPDHDAGEPARPAAAQANGER